MSAPKRTYKIAAIPADGVGVEVVAAGRAVLDALAHRTDRLPDDHQRLVLSIFSVDTTTNN